MKSLTETGGLLHEEETAGNRKRDMKGNKDYENVERTGTEPCERRNYLLDPSDP
jgi:hypothetical protein